MTFTNMERVPLKWAIQLDCSCIKIDARAVTKKERKRLLNSLPLKKLVRRIMAGYRHYYECGRIAASIRAGYVPVFEKRYLNEDEYSGTANLYIPLCQDCQGEGIANPLPRDGS